MIAEIKGKISSTGSNLSEWLEDKLTGDLFSSLRYIPFNKVAKSILLKTRVLKEGPSDILKVINKLNIDYWDENIQFWLYDSLGELDVLLEFEEIIIGVEVKLYSGLSSDDSVDNSFYDYKAESSNQLSRESKILKRKVAGTNKSALLIFIAPEYTCYTICKDVYDRNIIEDGIILGYLSWEEIPATLEEIVGIGKLNKYEELIIKDLITLMKRKGLERFKNFDFDCPNIDCQGSNFNEKDLGNKNGYRVSEPETEDIKNKYWGVKRTVYTTMDLLQLDSNNISGKVFGEFDILKNL